MPADCCAARRPFPQDRSDYPSDWRPLPDHPDLDVAQWTPDSDVFYCPDCGTTWLLVWQHKDFFLLATQVPAGHLSLLGDKATIATLWAALQSTPRGEVRGLLMSTAVAFLRHGDQQAHLDALVELLASGTLDLQEIRDAMVLLVGLLRRARDVVLAGSVLPPIGNPAWDRLRHHFRDALPELGLLGAAEAAVDSHREENPPSRPQLRLPRPDLLWALPGAARPPEGMNPSAITELRGELRGQVRELARLVTLRWHVVVIDDEWRERFRDLLDEDVTRREIVSRLEAAADSEHVGTEQLLEVADAAADLAQFVSSGGRIESDEALAVVAARRRLRMLGVVDTPELSVAMRKLDSALLNSARTAHLPGSVRAVLEWELMSRLGGRRSSPRTAD